MLRNAVNPNHPTRKSNALWMDPIHKTHRLLGGLSQFIWFNGSQLLTWLKKQGARCITETPYVVWNARRAAPSILCQAAKQQLSAILLGPTTSSMSYLMAGWRSFFSIHVTGKGSQPT